MDTDIPETGRSTTVKRSKRARDDGAADADIDTIVKNYLDIVRMKKAAKEECDRARDRKKAITKAEKEVRALMVSRMLEKDMLGYQSADMTFRVVTRETLVVSASPTV